MAKRNAVVVTHTRLRQSGTVVSEAVSQLRSAGFEVTIIDNTEAPDFGVSPACVTDDTEIVVVLGGDGTILRAAELVHCTQVPILGVNMGHVGFLAEFESFQIDEAIRRVAEHDYSIDERMIAHVDVWLPGATKPIEDWALNDITLERADRGKMVELSIRVDDVEMNSFGADGVIVRESRDTLRLARLSGVPFTNRLVSKFDLPVVGWREHARNEASGQPLHHGHTFPTAADAVSDRTDEHNGKAEG